VVELELEARPLRRDAQRNRERIVAAARTVFAEEGVDAPVEAVARRAGVGMGTLYRRFPTKEDLIDAVLEDALAEFTSAGEEALALEDAWEGLRIFLERIFALHVQNRCLKDVLAARAHGRARVEAMREKMRPLVKQLVERAQAQGALRPDFTPADVSLVLWSGGHIVDATAAIAPDAWRRYLGLLLDGLRADGATPLDAPPLTRSQVERVLERRRK